jgi:predicted acyltransferase
VLVAGGYSALLLAGFYWIVDIAGFQGWCRPFVWMGMNSITIYLLHNFMSDFDPLSQRLAGGDVHDLLERHWRGSGDLLVALVSLAIAFWVVHFLYRRKIFLRL